MEEKPQVTLEEKAGAGRGGEGKRSPERQANAAAAMPGRLLKRAFFARPPELVAPQLLGKILAHRVGRRVLAGRIVEVEAYLGSHNETPDPAAHAYRGPTPRNRVLFGPAGFAYVYLIYGRYFCANISCELEGQAGCVLLRALEPLADEASLALMARNRGLALNGEISPKLARQLTSGPSRLCQALGLTRLTHNGLDLMDEGSPLQVREDGFEARDVMVTGRIGISHAVDWPLRFALPGHPFVSGAKTLTGVRMVVG